MPSGRPSATASMNSVPSSILELVDLVEAQAAIIKRQQYEIEQLKIALEID